jgi:hypothetical protein
MRTRSRLLAALAALSINALLLSALMSTGRADAEPSASPPAQAAAVGTGDTVKEAAKVEVEAPKKPASKKSLARKLLPVKDFGGY